MSDGTNFMWLLSKVRFKYLEANTNNVVQGSFIEWIVFQTSFNVF